ncbi:hypothetical protein V497_05303, partial [Pseudogymnoascus sp. VKM F-4516 (FW-969)]
MPPDDPDNDDADGMSHRATASNTPPQQQFQPSPPPTAPAQPKSGAAPMDMLFMDTPAASHRDENPGPTAASPIARLTSSGLLSNTTATSLLSRSTHRSYDPIDGSSDRDADGFSANTSPLLTTSEGSKGDDLAGTTRRRLNIDSSTTTSPARFEIDEDDAAVTASTALLHEPVVRRASTRGVRVRHPTPGLQTLQGAYTANVVQLERSAEKLSMTSSIEDSIRNAYEEVKKSDSRMNSLRQSSLLNLVTDIPYETRPTQITSAAEVQSPTNFASPTYPTRDTNSSHSTTSTSILDVNNAARSGGYSPGGAVILGARPRADSKSSKTSKYGTRPEPEMEGRPLSEFVSSRNNSYLSSRNVSRAPSIAEKEEEAEAEVRRPLAIRNLSADDIDVDEEKTDIGLNKIIADDSQSEMEQAQELFDDFDGQHYANQAAPPAPPTEPPAAQPRPELDRRSSSANTLSMARPKSYADPLTGQQMVFYPAPVPSMLMLPQKLSNRPSPAKREKRRTQALSTLPPIALQSAPWLQDVVEGEAAQPEQVPDEVLDSEYLAQHHRQKVGGRRSTQDMLNMPEHLRANEYFEQPQPHQIVEIKGQSAVATLDDILNASAYAPVGAFTDHTFAGRLGAEVYGAHDPRTTRTKSQLLTPEPPTAKKRVSSFFGLGLGGNKNDDRTSTVTSILGLNKTPSYTAVAEDSQSP